MSRLCGITSEPANDLARLCLEPSARTGPRHYGRSVWDWRWADRHSCAWRVVWPGSTAGPGYGAGDGGAQCAVGAVALSPAQPYRLAACVGPGCTEPDFCC